MRVITGIYKGRRFDVPRNFKARPTTDFAKENLFNVLRAYIDFEEVEALDLFAGTGSISLELLSRGCKQVTSVELDRLHYSFISKVMSELKAPNIKVLQGDAIKFISKARQSYDLIFADPPYQLRELAEIPNKVMASTLLRPNGIFVLEHGKNINFSDRTDFIEHRAYGSVNFSFFKHSTEKLP